MAGIMVFVFLKEVQVSAGQTPKGWEIHWASRKYGKCRVPQSIADFAMQSVGTRVVDREIR